MDVANPPGEGRASYLCPLSLQIQEAPVPREAPWGLLVLSGPWGPPCQALLKKGSSELPGAHGSGLHRQISHDQETHCAPTRTLSLQAGPNPASLSSSSLPLDHSTPSPQGLWLLPLPRTFL